MFVKYGPMWRVLVLLILVLRSGVINPETTAPIPKWALSHHNEAKTSPGLEWESLQSEIKKGEWQKLRRPQSRAQLRPPNQNQSGGERDEM